MAQPVGYFFDPKHGGCLRIISRARGRTLRIRGAYGSDEPDTGTAWTATASMDSRTLHGDVPLTVHFAGKKHLTHSPHYTATWHPKRRRITWQDGNTWTQMYTAPSMLPTWRSVSLWLLLMACIGLSTALAVSVVERNELGQCESELLSLRVRHHPPFNASADRFHTLANDDVWYANDSPDLSHPSHTARKCHGRHVRLLRRAGRTTSSVEGRRLEAFDGLNGQ